MAEIPALYAQRPIVNRHTNAALYHPFVEAVALTVVDVPVTFVSTSVFALVLYFMVGLQQTAVSFFSLTEEKPFLTRLLIRGNSCTCTYFLA